MDKELIERLAREAGVEAVGYWTSEPQGLERFAALIAEECAKIVETASDYLQNSTFDGAAAAIRATFATPHEHIG